MRNDELEARVLAVIDSVRAGRKNEDDRIELKTEWPEAQKAARRIAGHANAARSDWILWIIGIDEKTGVLAEVREDDLADWWPRVRQEFDGIPPALRHLVVPVDASRVIALYLDTDRPPYVVRNPAFGAKGVSADREVPWREGTAVRSARREDLLRILSPLQKAPSVEILWGWARLALSSAGKEHKLNVRCNLYLTPLQSDKLVIPFHGCRGWLAIGPLEEVELEGLALTTHVRRTPLDRTTYNVHTSPSEAVFDGPGLVKVLAHADLSAGEVPFEDAVLRLSLSTAPPARVPTVISCALLPAKTREGFLYWSTSGTVEE